MVKSTLQILRDMLELLTPDGRWTQGVEARDISGNEVNPWQKSAVCYCLAGAARRVGEGGIAIDAMNLMAALRDVDNIEQWNDHDGRTHEQVLEVIREAIEEELSTMVPETSRPLMWPSFFVSPVPA
jgi:hypothetical protein